MSYSSDHHSTPSFYYRAQHTEQEVFANGRLALVLEMHKLSQACRKGTHPHSLIYHWNLPLYMFKRKELRHGYTHVLPTRPPLRSQAVAFHQPWPHRGGTREESPTSPGMNVLLPRGAVTRDKVLVRPQEARGRGGDLALLTHATSLAWGAGGGGLMPNPCPRTSRPHRL
jgi:hypothetical protein